MTPARPTLHPCRTLAPLLSMGEFVVMHNLRNFWVLSSGGHEWANWRRYTHQTAQIMFPDCD